MNEKDNDLIDFTWDIYGDNLSLMHEEYDKIKQLDESNAEHNIRQTRLKAFIKREKNLIEFNKAQMRYDSIYFSHQHILDKIAELKNEEFIDDNLFNIISSFLVK